MTARAGSGNYGRWGLQHAAHNDLVAGSSPASPTTQSRRNGSFHETAKKVRQFRGLAGHGALSPVSLSGLRGLLREFVLGVS